MSNSINNIFEQLDAEISKFHASIDSDAEGHIIIIENIANIIDQIIILPDEYFIQYEQKIKDCIVIIDNLQQYFRARQTQLKKEILNINRQSSMYKVYMT